MLCVLPWHALPTCPGDDGRVCPKPGRNRARSSGGDRTRESTHVSERPVPENTSQDPTAERLLRAASAQGLKSRTISTTAFTFSTGVSGRIPWPKLKMCPGLVPVRFNNS